MGSAIVWQVWGENFFQTAKNICHAMTTLLDLAEAAALAQKWFRVENKRSAAAVDTNDADGTVQQQAQKKLRLHEVPAPLAASQAAPSLAPARPTPATVSESAKVVPVATVTKPIKVATPTTVTEPVKVAPVATPSTRVLRKLPLVLATDVKLPLTDETVQEVSKNLLLHNNLEGGTIIRTFATHRDGQPLCLALFQPKGEPATKVPYRWLHDRERTYYFGISRHLSSLWAAGKITMYVWRLRPMRAHAARARASQRRKVRYRRRNADRL